jgi:hypothetical protein
MIEVAPVGPEHIDRLRRTIDAVAREGRYLAIMEAPPVEKFRALVEGLIKNGHP